MFGARKWSRDFAAQTTGVRARAIVGSKRGVVVPVVRPQCAVGYFPVVGGSSPGAVLGSANQDEEATASRCCQNGRCPVGLWLPAFWTQKEKGYENEKENEKSNKLRK